MSNPQDPNDSHAPEPPELPHPELKPPDLLGSERPVTPGSPPPGNPPAGPAHGASAAESAAPPPGYGTPDQPIPSRPDVPAHGQPIGPEYGSPGWGPPSAPSVPTYDPTGYAADAGWGGPSVPGGPTYGSAPGYGANPGYAGVPPGYDQAPGAHGQPGYGPSEYGQAPGYPVYGEPPPDYGRPASGHDRRFQPPEPDYGYPPAGYGPPPPYASWLQRVGAAILDGLLVGIPAWILDFLGNVVGSHPVTCTTYGDGSRVCTGGGLTSGGALLVGLGALVGIAGALYLLYLEGTTGQTPGKRVLGIKLIREADGQVMGFWWCVLRSICHILDSLPCYLGYLWPLWDDKRQTFADKIMKTIVVKV